MTTTTSKRLGRLEKVVLREVWGNDSQEFVQWLSHPENIGFLGDAIGKELRIAPQNSTLLEALPVDIVCQDSNGTPVFVKVQFDQTSDDQLGQLLVAARHAERAMIIWIADRITDIHRGVLTWLNRITMEAYDFYGMEVDFWRIGTSALAPTMTLVARPDDDATAPPVSSSSQGDPASESAAQSAAASMSVSAVSEDAAPARPTVAPVTPFLEYWLAFNGHLLQRKSPVIGQKPTNANWMSFPIGGPYYYLVATVSPRDHFVAVGLVLSGTEASRHFQVLLQARASIEMDVGTALEWLEVPDKSEYRILVRRYGFDPNDRSQWETQHGWLAEKLERFQWAFSVRVEAIEGGDSHENSNVAFAGVSNLSASQ